MGGYIGFNPSDGAGELRTELTPKIKNNQDNIIELWANDLADCGYNLAATFEYGGILSNRFDLVVSLDRQRAYSWKGNFPVDIANAHITHSNWVPWSIDQMGAGNLLEIKWLSSRKLLGSPLWGGFVAADGGIFSRILYPDTWAAVNAGLVQVCPESDWVADPTKRHCYTTGDGTTTFRVPDLNGAYRHPSDSSKNSIPGLFLRGDNGSDFGYIQRDAAPNITGQLSNIVNIFGFSPSDNSALTADYNGSMSNAVSSTNSGVLDVKIDASRVSASYGRREINGAAASEVRPNSAVGCYAIRLQGRVVNPGTVDLLSLVDKVAAMPVGKTLGSNEIPSMKYFTYSRISNIDIFTFPNGMMIQIGKLASTTPGSGVNVTFPVPFSASPAVTLQPTSLQGTVACTAGPSATEIRNVTTFDAVGNVGAANGVMWIAIGVA